VLFIITFISIIIYGLLSEINRMDGWLDRAAFYSVQVSGMFLERVSRL